MDGALEMAMTMPQERKVNENRNKMTNKRESVEIDEFIAICGSVVGEETVLIVFVVVHLVRSSLSLSLCTGVLILSFDINLGYIESCLDTCYNLLIV